MLNKPNFYQKHEDSIKWDKFTDDVATVLAVGYLRAFRDHNVNLRQIESFEVWDDPFIFKTKRIGFYTFAQMKPMYANALDVTLEKLKENWDITIEGKYPHDLLLSVAQSTIKNKMIIKMREMELENQSLDAYKEAEEKFN